MLRCLQKCDQGKARLTEGESFKCEGVSQNFTFKAQASSIEQGTGGNKKQQQLAKEYREKVRICDNSFQKQVLE